MSEFLFLYRGGDASESREQMQKTMEVWMAWFKELGASGCIKDMGNPLEPGGKVVASSTSVTDGPYAETKDVIGGYTLIEAADLAAASEIAKGCPILAVGGCVEVRPILQMSM